MPYQLLVCDLDGTLFGHDLTVSPAVRAALARWQAAGRILAIATGRMYRSTVGFARDLGVTAPVICYQGALIRSDDEVVWHKTLAADVALEALKALEGRGFSAQLFFDDRLWVTHVNADTRAYLALSRVEPNVVGSWEEVLAKGRPTKIVAIAPSPDVVIAVAAMRAQFGGRLHATQSQPTFLECVDPAVNKGEAVKALAARLGVPLDQVVAVGDGQNDVEMIRAAGLGVVMGSGHPELRAAAGRVTGSLADDGVATLIEGLLAEDPPEG